MRNDCKTFSRAKIRSGIWNVFAWISRRLKMNQPAESFVEYGVWDFPINIIIYNFFLVFLFSFFSFQIRNLGLHPACIKKRFIVSSNFIDSSLIRSGFVDHHKIVKSPTSPMRYFKIYIHTSNEAHSETCNKGICLTCFHSKRTWEQSQRVLG